MILMDKVSRVCWLSDLLLLLALRLASARRFAIERARCPCNLCISLSNRLADHESAAGAKRGATSHLVWCARNLSLQVELHTASLLEPIEWSCSFTRSKSTRQKSQTTHRFDPIRSSVAGLSSSGDANTTRQCCSSNRHRPHDSIMVATSCYAIRDLRSDAPRLALTRSITRP